MTMENRMTASTNALSIAARLRSIVGEVNGDSPPGTIHSGSLNHDGQLMDMPLAPIVHDPQIELGRHACWQTKKWLALRPLRGSRRLRIGDVPALPVAVGAFGEPARYSWIAMTGFRKRTQLLAEAFGPRLARNRPNVLVTAVQLDPRVQVASSSMAR
jgi:hypothetical protein